MQVELVARGDEHIRSEMVWMLGLQAQAVSDSDVARGGNISPVLIHQTLVPEARLNLDGATCILRPGHVQATEFPVPNAAKAVRRALEVPCLVLAAQDAVVQFDVRVLRSYFRQAMPR